MTQSHDTERPVLNTTRARQGAPWGRTVFWVLVFSTLLAALGMFAAWGWQDDDNRPSPAPMERADGRTFDTPEPPPATPPK